MVYDGQSRGSRWALFLLQCLLLPVLLVGTLDEAAAEVTITNDPQPIVGKVTAGRPYSTDIKTAGEIYDLITDVTAKIGSISLGSSQGTNPNLSIPYEYTPPSNTPNCKLIEDTVTVISQSDGYPNDPLKVGIDLTVLNPLTVTNVSPSSQALKGAPGETVTFTADFAGGRSPYGVTSDLGAQVDVVGTNKVEYKYTIPSDKQGVINDTVTLKGATTTCGGDSATIDVRIEVLPALSATPDELDLRGAPGETVEGTVTVSGGVPGYTAKAGLGKVSPASLPSSGSTLTYSYRIPSGSAGTIEDRITVTDSEGGTATVVVDIAVTAAPALVVNPSPIELSALSLVNVTTQKEQQFNVSGGTPPYALAVASGGRGTVEPARLAAPGNATYSVDIPANEKTASTISDRILVTDAKGVKVEVPATVQVGASNTLSSRPDLTPNERSAARAIETVCPQLAQMGGNRNAAQEDLLEQCSDMLSNPGSSGIPNTLGQITDEKARASTSAGIEVGNQQLSNVGSRLADLRGGSAGVDVQGFSFNIAGQSVSAGKVAGLVANQLSGGAASADTSESMFGRWGFFLKGTFNFGDKNSTENETGFDFDTNGITGGADYRFSEKLVAGGAVGFSRNNVDYASNGGGLDTDTWHLAAYGSYSASERTYIDAIVEYGWQDHDSERGIQYRVASNLSPVKRIANANYDGNQLGASLGAGYDLDQGPLSYGLYGRVGYIKVDVDGFQEKGAGGLNLKLDDFDATSVTTILGARISRVFNTTKAVIVPQLRFGWEHEYNNDATNLVARFAADPINTSFGIVTDSPDRDYFRLGLGVSAVFPHGVSAFVNYDTLLDKRNWTDHLIDLGVRWEF